MFEKSQSVSAARVSEPTCLKGEEPRCAALALNLHGRQPARGRRRRRRASWFVGAYGKPPRILRRIARRGLAALALLVPCLPTSGQTPPAEERCAGLGVDVKASSAEERQLACSAAGDAIALLGRCKITLQRPLRLKIQSEVRHPLNGRIFGLFDTTRDLVLVTQQSNIPSLAKDTPYATLPPVDFYRSLIVHEIVHGVMHQNLTRSVTTHAAYEYSAYALQIASMSEAVREQFLRNFDSGEIRAKFLFNDIVLFFNPFFFAARAYMHFRDAADGCAHLQGVLRGDAGFIAQPVM
jgi:hypothetical protein